MNDIQIFETPVRKISNRGVRKVIGHFASLKNGGPVPWESQLERDNLYLTEFDKDVIEYRTQTVRIYYRMKNTKSSFLSSRKFARIKALRSG